MISFEPEAILPHRFPMLLLDSVALDGELARGEKTIRPEEFFLQGHFPDHSMVPGVILCEILAQTALALFAQEDNKGLLPFLTGLDKVRFRVPVHPNDCISTEVHLIKQKGHFYWAEGKGFVDGKLCVQASFSFSFQPDS